MCVCLSLVIGFCLMVTDQLDWSLLLKVFLIKYVVDYVLLFKANQYLLKGKWLLPLSSSLIYPLFSSMVGIYSLIGPFSWKNRRY